MEINSNSSNIIFIIDLFYYCIDFFSMHNNFNQLPIVSRLVALPLLAAGVYTYGRV